MSRLHPFIIFISSFIARYPNITDDMNPASITPKDMSIVAISFICITPAPTTAGTDKRKLYLAAYSLSSPRHSPDAMVEPERDIPGSTASP